MESAPPTLLKEISCYVCIRYSIVCVFYPRFVSTLISIFAAMSSSSRSFSDATNTGRVKWFNSKYGYGFITLVKKAVVEGGSEADDEPRLDSDIFVHHSSINVASEQYRYLMQGVYVEFQIVKSTSDKYRFQAAAVSGCGGGKLMCETKKEMYDARVSTEPRTAEGEATERRPPTRRRAPQGDLRTQRRILGFELFNPPIALVVRHALSLFSANAIPKPLAEHGQPRAWRRHLISLDRA